MASDYPPLPENGRTHYAIYTEASRGDRVELTMFNLPSEIGSDAELVIENGTLTVDCSTLYTDDIKYYLDEFSGTWIEFESGYPKISDNIGTLYYSDLNYIFYASAPGGENKKWNVNPAPDGYYVTVYDNDVMDFYFTKDFMDYKWITYRSAPEKFNMKFPSTELNQLGFLNGEYVIIENWEFYTPPQYKTVGGVYELAYIYDLNGNLISTKSNSVISYNWFNNCFDICVSEVTADGISGARGVPAAITYNFYHSEDLENYIQEDYNEYNYDIDDKFEIMDLGNYSLISETQSFMRYDSESGTWKKDVYYPKFTKTLYKYYLRYDNGEEYKVQFYGDCSVYKDLLICDSDDLIMYSTNGVYYTKVKKSPEKNNTRKYWTEGNLLCVSNNNSFIKTPILNNDGIFVRLNDEILSFSEPPVIESDFTLVPMRHFLERMGAKVLWDEDTQTATAVFGSEDAEKTVVFAIDNNIAYVNGAEIVMDVPARMINGHTFIPLRFLSENLGCKVEWNEEQNTAVVTVDVKN